MPAKLAIASRAATEMSGGELSVELVSAVEDAVRDADLAIDCVPDELESKLEILWLLDRMAPPKMVIATPTTQQSIVDLASCTYRPDRCVAIVVDPRTLSGPGSGHGSAEITIRTTATTLPEASALVAEFWRNLGFVPQVEVASS